MDRLLRYTDYDEFPAGCKAGHERPHRIAAGIEQLDRGEGIPDDQLDAHLTNLKAKLNERALSSIIAPQAALDLVEIWRYIKEQTSRTMADRVGSAIREKIEFLARTPAAGHSRKDLTDEDVKIFRVDSYLIVYRPQTTTIASRCHSPRMP